MCLSSLHLRYLVTHASSLARQHGVGHGGPYTHKFGEVEITGKAVYLVILAVGLEFQHLLYVAEVADKIIEVEDVILLHHVSRDEVAHERPYLCGGVADRCTCRKDNILAAGLF